MKSKEDMIQIMAMAIMEEDGMDYDMPYSSLAEAALKALCGALPEEDNEWHAVDILHELKQYGENKNGVE